MRNNRFGKETFPELVLEMNTFSCPPAVPVAIVFQMIDNSPLIRGQVKMDCYQLTDSGIPRCLFQMRGRSAESGYLFATKIKHR